MQERGSPPDARPHDPARRLADMAAVLLAVDPAGLGGALLRGGPSLMRDAWLRRLRDLLPEGTPFRKAPASAPPGRLCGGLDLAATLSAGRPVAEKGLLAESHGGVLVAAMAERIDPLNAALIAAAMDGGETRLERDGMSVVSPSCFALILLDESEGDDPPPPAPLRERVAFLLSPQLGSSVDTTPFDRAAVLAARAASPQVVLPDDVIRAIDAASRAFGAEGLRTLIFSARAAIASAALAGRRSVEIEDAELACSLVVAPRATRAPEPDPMDDAPDAEDQARDNVDDGATAAPEDVSQLDERVIDAVRATLPPGLLSSLAAAQSSGRTPIAAGRSGALRASLRKGRPFASKPGDPRNGSRLQIIESLRAAAPMQRLRGRTSNEEPIRVRPEDFRIARYRDRRRSLAMFVVDASGSSAAQRLAEAKGAIEFLLAECYSRRDEVALISFRKDGAELLLSPTRSLVRARRELARLPGGGGTPLAAGLEAAASLAAQSAAKGMSPTIVVMSDGRANVAIGGEGGRAKAHQDAVTAARKLRSAGATVLFFDTSVRPEPLAREIASEIGARYIPLPFASSKIVSDTVRKARAE